jgi:hypothetical protein
MDSRRRSSHARAAIVRTICRAASAELIFALLLLFPCHVIAPGGSEGELMFPLSDSQTQKSIDAFVRVAAAFTQEERCANAAEGSIHFLRSGAIVTNVTVACRDGISLSRECPS